ncbi:MAG: ASPIC/UnbV domain-containing protein, partial [Pirellulaceae bacterium]
LDGGMGQMLRGLGNGQFIPLSPLESGIIVTGQGAAVSVVDFNSDLAPDLAMTVNDEPMRSWVNKCKTTRVRLAIRLKGGVGNRAAIGGRVVARTRSGVVQAMEVRAGSGYLSQSTTNLFLASDPADPVESVSITWPDGFRQQRAVQSDEDRVVVIQQSHGTNRQ